MEQLDWGTKRGIIKALIGQIKIGRDQVEVGFQIEELAQDGGILNLYHCTTHHDKGAGEVCQVSFFVSIPNKSLLYGYARSLLLVNVLWLYGKFIAIQLILKAI